MLKRAVVTGGSGVIGRQLVDRLAKAGVVVMSLDREPLDPVLAGKVEEVRVDLAHGGMEEIAAFQPDTVFHLAAAFERSIEEPGFWEPNGNDNLAVTHRLHTLLRTLPAVRTYIFASSYLLYDPALYMFDQPRPAARLLPEDAPLRPRNLCGAAKYLAEAEIRFLTEVDRLPLRAVSARIYRSYGLGSRDVISRWARSCLRGEPITVYNPQNRFDYVFATDVAEGLHRMAAVPSCSGTVNLASGRDRAVADVVKAVLAETGRPDSHVTRGEDSAPFEASAADMARCRQLLGWAPETSLEEGIRQIVRHERSALGLC